VWTNKKILIPVLFLAVWFGINFYQIKTAHNRCYEMGYLRGHPESIPCFDREQKIEKENLQLAIKQISIYIWALGE